ncbi:HisA/HisF-related TIM barrel protein [Methyloligella sp. 2.7D]|uniref:HisA/HisF-related TIM barrel protein n=1 Tax=unclassified Methyloligella TaxID=2625955 RepID=UPI00157CB34A|nr:HisA/HisF-related TIM barrel protein [Methyloligella sp. GL2]QKP77781.1 nickel transporter [Methyloligella sp. GL2]
MSDPVTSDFAAIPVLDLKAGQVVRGVAGNRAEYRSIETPLGPADQPVALGLALHDLAEAPILYAADLDAIQEGMLQADIAAAIAEALRPAELWLDSGVSGVQAFRQVSALGAVPVIGSESLSTLEQWQDLRQEGASVLSLDFDAQGFRGPVELLDPAYWPGRVIVMTLAKVGMDGGPDLARLAEIARNAPEGTKLYAAGGVRGIADLESLREAGVSGALIASALHSGALTQKEIAAFRRRRRF